jgi:hypothetical protein
MSILRLATIWVPGNVNDRSVEGFRIRHGGRRGPMSKSKYHRLKNEGRAPRETVIGPNTTLITVADELAWDQERANPTDTEARLIAKVKAMRVKRAKKAAVAAAASPLHVSKQRKRR